jgi:hypothetical protein
MCRVFGWRSASHSGAARGESPNNMSDFISLCISWHWRITVLISYPVKAEHGDSPDFMLTGDLGERRALKITRATDAELQR